MTNYTPQQDPPPDGPSPWATILVVIGLAILLALILTCGAWDTPPRSLVVPPLFASCR
jgi:hypothetical protein